MNLQVRRVYLLGQLSVCCCVYNLGDLNWRCGTDQRQEEVLPAVWCHQRPVSSRSSDQHTWTRSTMMASSPPIETWSLLSKMLLAAGMASTNVSSTPGASHGPRLYLEHLIHIGAPWTCCWRPQGCYYNCWMIAIPHAGIILTLPQQLWCHDASTPYYYDYNITGNVACDRHLFVFITGLIWAALLNKPTVNNQMQYPDCYHSF